MTLSQVAEDLVDIQVRHVDRAARTVRRVNFALTDEATVALCALLVDYVQSKALSRDSVQDNASRCEVTVDATDDMHMEAGL